MLHKCLTLAACAGLVACVNPPAAANVTQSVWISNTQFAYRINSVPDFDQRRTTLPVNGANYCVPTSFMNWSAYIARRGHPDQLPGSPPWNYIPITVNILLLGAAMDTDPDSGTNPSDGVAGASAWLSDHAFCLVVTGNTTSGFPRLRTLANNAINNNCLVVPRVGWYNEDDYPRIVRTGGHAVSMVRAAAAGVSNQLIGIHDPAWSPDGDTQTVQSAFTMNQYAVEDRVVLEGVSVLPSTMSRIVGYGRGYIYGAYYIIPHVVLTPVSFNFHVLSNSFQNAGLTTSVVSNPNGGTITGVFPAMDPSQIFYTADEPGGATGRLVRYDRTENTHSLVMTLGSDFVDACHSRFDTLFVLQGRTLSRVNPYDPAGPVEASLVIGTGIDCIAYDDSSDRIFALRPVAREILRVPGALNGGASTMSIPTQVPVAPGGVIDVRPLDGSVLIATPASTSAYWVLPQDIAAPIVQTITIPGNTFPITGGSFTDRGVILVANGLMKEMVLDANGAWTLDTASPFHNKPASSGKIVAGRSRVDVDRATENDPANRDVMAFDFSGARHVVSCPADLNGDGIVNFADLNAVLTSFGETGPNPSGDTDGDGDVDFTDLNTVLSNFGDNCG